MGSNQSWILKNEIAQKNLLKISEFRIARNISRYELAKLIGVNYDTVYGYEYGKHYPTRKTYNKLAQLFGWDVIEGKQYKQTRNKKDVGLEEQTGTNRKSMNRVFEIGKCYKVSTTKSNIGDNWAKATWDANCIFRYEGKQGIHHCFREINGGWTRTYTNYQLIGKYIEQVDGIKHEKE